MNVPLNAPVSAVAGAATAAPPRLAHVDALRGFALFGILVVNIGVFASPFYANGITDPAFSRPWDLAMRWLVAWLFETKFYLLFSFLFGYSFTLQMSAAERGGAAFGPRFLRRLLGLALLGLAHAVLFYQGDILLTYAALGVVLMACRRMDPGRALRRALWLIGLVSLAWTLLGALSLLDPAGTVELSRAANGVAVADSQAAIEAYRGTIGSTVARHWHELTTSIWGVILLVQGPFVFAMFLVGYALGRRQALADPWRQPRALWLLCALGALPGLAGSAAYATTALPSMSPLWETPGLAMDLFTAPLLSMSYAAALLLAIRTPPGLPLARPLPPAAPTPPRPYLLPPRRCPTLVPARPLRPPRTPPPAATLAP
ncbi:DUF418 domain-containing protein, partial [Achromobacter ruhlandii]|uniref:DUF418 domain-containing protein n=1 Tax=Achromobacter ruhlandii TaxID=72557 RepID=UPI002015F80D